MGNERGYRDRIVIDPKVHFGKPCIAGTRITVADVLELVQEGVPFQITIEWLRKKGHDVVTAREIGMARAADEELLAKAIESTV